MFFRAETIGDAFYVLGNMFYGITNPAQYVSQITTYLGKDKLTLIGMMISIGMLLVFDYCSLTRDVLEKLKEKKTAVRWIVYVVFILFLIFNIPATSGQEFIYFQF